MNDGLVIPRPLYDLMLLADQYTDAPPRRRRGSRMGVELRVSELISAPSHWDEIHGCRFWPAADVRLSDWNQTPVGILSRIRSAVELMGFRLVYRDLSADEADPSALYMVVEVCPVIQEALAS